MAKNDGSAAIAAVDRAIDEVKNAAKGNAKDLDAAPRMEDDTSPRDAQLRKALDELKSAKKSVEQSKGNVEVQDERKRGIHEIERGDSPDRGHDPGGREVDLIGARITPSVEDVARGVHRSSTPKVLPGGDHARRR